MIIDAFFVFVIVTILAATRVVRESNHWGRK